MQLRTEIQPTNSRGAIGYTSHVMLIGSCFADEIGGRLADANFDVAVNPLGTLYNPLSIKGELRAAIYGEAPVDDLVVESGRYWVSMQRHSRFRAETKEEMKRIVADSARYAADFLRDATHLILTFGSAVHFRHLPTGQIVANCQKQSANLIACEEETVPELIESVDRLIDSVLSINPAIKILLTVSPVRHYDIVKDRLSKSRLIVLCHEMEREYECVEYFPAYEAIVDDLRDYRFYAEDMKHPAKVAADYVFDLFKQTYFDEATDKVAAAWRKNMLLTQHIASNIEDAERHKLTAIQNAARLAADTPRSQEAFNRFINRFYPDDQYAKNISISK